MQKHDEQQASSSIFSIENLMLKAQKIMDGPLCHDKALLIAVLFHGGQRDKNGAAYIRHVVRVAEGTSADGGTEDEQIIALLHDLVEDTEVELEDLASLGMSHHQIDTVDSLTKREGESYEEGIQRAARNHSARRIKKVDILDNSEAWRFRKSSEWTEKDMERVQRYQNALPILGYRRS